MATGQSGHKKGGQLRIERHESGRGLGNALSRNVFDGLALSMAQFSSSPSILVECFPLVFPALDGATLTVAPLGRRHVNQLSKPGAERGDGFKA